MKKLIVVSVLASQLIGCATIMNGSRQRIPIATSPTGVMARADGRESKSCETPCTLLLSRRTAHTILFTKGGYESASAAIDSSASGWLWGNLLLGGPIGLLVDVISGGAWKLKPAQISKDLQKN